MALTDYMKQLHAKCKGKRRHASKVMRNIFSPYNVINLFWQPLIIQGQFAVPFVSSCMLRRDPAINIFFLSQRCLWCDLNQRNLLFSDSPDFFAVGDCQESRYRQQLLWRQNQFIAHSFPTAEISWAWSCVAYWIGVTSFMVDGEVVFWGVSTG